MRSVVALVAAGILMCGCAIGSESSAHVVNRQLAPKGLLAPASTEPVTRSDVPSDNVTLFLELAQNLVTVDRAVAPPVTLDVVLDVLARGPNAREQTQGMQSPLSTVGRITLRSMEDGVATVDLPGDFTALGGQDQILAVAQLVYTATAFPGVDQVVVLVNGQPTVVPTANGSLSGGPLSRSDYDALAPR